MFYLMVQSKSNVTPSNEPHIDLKYLILHGLKSMKNLKLNVHWHYLKRHENFTLLKYFTRKSVDY